MNRAKAEGIARKLLPKMPGNPVSHVAIPLGALEALLRESPLSPIPLAEIAVMDVLDFGAAKHAGNLVEEGSGATLEEHLRAAQRHLKAYRDGVRADPETGRSPLAHAAARLLLSTELETQRGGGHAAGT